MGDAQLQSLRRDLRVDQGRLDVLVPEEALDDADVDPRFEQVGGAAVTQGVRTHHRIRVGWRLPNANLEAARLADRVRGGQRLSDRARCPQTLL